MTEPGSTPEAPGRFTAGAVRGLVGGSKRRKTYLQTVVAGYGYTAAATAVNLALVPILVGGLGQRGYGIWLTTAALVQWVLYPSGLLVPGFVKRIGDHLAKQDPDNAARVAETARVLYRAVVLAVAAGVAFLTTRDEIGFLGGEVSDETRWTLVLAAAWLLLQIEAQVDAAVLTAAQRLYVVHAIQAGVVLAAGGAAGILVLVGFGLPAVAGSYAVAAAVGLAAYKIARRRVLRVATASRSFDRTVVRDTVPITLPYFFSGAGWLLLASDILLLAFLTTPATVAAYGIVFKVVETMLQLVWRFADATQPYIVELNALDDRDALRRLYRRANEASLIVGGCLAAVFFFLGDRLLAAWVGAGNAAGLDVVRVLCVFVFLQAFVHASFVFPFSTARMKVAGPLLLGEGVAKVVLAVTLVEMGDSWGVAAASVIATLLVSGWYLPLSTMRWLGIPPIGFLGGLVKRALPLPVATAAAALLASQFVDEDGSATAAALAVVVVAAGVAVGALATLTLRARGT